MYPFMLADIPVNSRMPPVGDPVAVACYGSAACVADPIRPALSGAALQAAAEKHP